MEKRSRTDHGSLQTELADTGARLSFRKDVKEGQKDNIPSPEKYQGKSQLQEEAYNLGSSYSWKI